MTAIIDRQQTTSRFAMCMAMPCSWVATPTAAIDL
jgi:hypothetical protein